MFHGTKNNILLKFALVLAIVDLALIVAILLQVNNLVKDVLEVQNRQIEIGVMEERQNNLNAKVVDVDFNEGQWQTYKNEEFSFEIKHPKAWKVSKIDELPKNQLAAFSIDDPASPLRSVPAAKLFCNIAIYENKSDLSLKDWIDDRYKVENVGVGVVISKMEPFVLSNSKEGQKVFVSGNNASRIISIYLPFNGKIYSISYATQFETDKVLAVLKYKEICEKIANTYFKFTD